MKTYDLDNIFSIADVDDNQVIIKVHADSPLKVAQYPFISGEYEYITVTRGKSHLLKIIYKDGNSFSFHWGGGSSTMIDEELKELKQQVVLFIEQNYIFLDYSGEPITKIEIWFNSNVHLWQVSLEPTNSYYWSHTASSVDDMIKEVEPFGIFAEKWEKSVAQTGIDVWTAVNPKLSIK